MNNMIILSSHMHPIGAILVIGTVACAWMREETRTFIAAVFFGIGVISAIDDWEKGNFYMLAAILVLLFRRKGEL